MSLVINYTKNLQVTTLLNNFGKMIKMRDIVDSKFIVAHQEEILKTGDIIPEVIFKYIPQRKIYEYFEYNTKHNKMFADEFKTIDEWLNSEKSLDDYYLYCHDLIDENDYDECFQYKLDILEDWVECYPQFEEMLNRQYFDEYLNNRGIVDQSVELKLIEKSFHNIIMKRAGRFIEEYEVPLPQITTDLINNESYDPVEFPIPYGGFYYTLSIEDGEYLLSVESWSRVVEGSGECHVITKDSCKLIAEGFV